VSEEERYILAAVLVVLSIIGVAVLFYGIWLLLK
jgi:hypothetical protein